MSWIGEIKPLFSCVNQPRWLSFYLLPLSINSKSAVRKELFPFCLFPNLANVYFLFGLFPVLDVERSICFHGIPRDSMSFY